MIFILLHSQKRPFSGTHRLSIKLSVFFFCSRTMPECHKLYTIFNWHVPPEWFGLKFNSGLLAKVHWNYTTHILRVCVSSKSPKIPNLAFTKKSNLQNKFGSRALASLYGLLCHHFLTNNDPLLEELLSYLPT